MPDLFSLGGGTPDAPPAQQPAPASAPNLTLPQLGSGAGYVTQDQINAAATAAGVDPDLYTRVVRRESAGNIAAKSAKGALGPAQIMPTTAPQGVDIADPVQNLGFGAKYLKSMLDRYGGDQERALAAYNAGPDAVDKAGGVPNIPETQAYVSSIMGGGAPDLFALGGGPGGAVPTNIKYEPGHGVGGPGQPGEAGVPDPQKLAYSFLAKNGFYDPNAEVGSPSRPAAQVPGQGIPSEQFSWYITPDGKLRQTGVDNVDDYIPAYQRVLQLRSGVQKGLGPGLTTATGFGQGLIDIGQSANKLSGGALGGTYEAATGQGFDLSADAYRSLARDVEERNDYNLLFGGNPLAAGGRFVGQTIPVMAATMGTTRGLGALGEPGLFLAGRGGGNLLTQGLSRATGGAIQGAETAGLTSSTSDRPLTDQLLAGTTSGAGLGVGLPVAAGAAQRIIGGPALVEGPVKDLANLAATKYGMTGDAGFRVGQLKGAAGDRAAATADSELLGSSPGFLANNEAQRQKWMQGVTSTYEDPSGDVSPPALAANKAAIGGEINGVADKVGTIDASGAPAKLDAVINEAKQVVGASDAKPLQNLVKNIKSVIGPDGTLSAAAYQGLTRHDGPLMTAISNADTPYAGRIKDVLDDALEASADPADVAALQNARWKYKNLMTVARAAQNQNNIGADGVFTPNALNTATTSNFKQRAFQGAGDLDELNAIRKRFMTEPPNSFSADRAAFRLSGIDTAIAGAAEGAGLLFQHPEAGAAALGGLLATKAIQAGAKAVKQARFGPAAGNRLLNNSPPPVYGPVPPYLLPAGALAGKNLLLAPHQ